MTFLKRCQSALAIVAFLAVSKLAGAGAVAPLILHPADQDANLNCIADALEAEVAAAFASGNPGLGIRIIVTLYNLPSDGDISLFRRLGGVVSHRYGNATYGFAGLLPANKIAELASSLGERLCIIESDLPGGGTLDDSARQVRVRTLVWDTNSGYGLDGDPSIVIAILDSGIDTTHTDLSGGRLVFWHDFTSESEPNSTDRNGHGTHVSGIAAGTGAALGSGTITSLTTTMSGKLPQTSGNGYVDMVKVPVMGSSQVTSNLAWQGTGTAQINLATSSAGWLGGYVSSSSPLTHTWSISTTDIYKARAGNSSSLGGRPYSMLVTYPYTSVGDGFNLFRGIAPACRLAGAKLLEQDGTGWSSEWTAAFDSLASVNSLYNIKVANASIGLFSGGTSTSLRTAVNSLVSAGTVVVISAGNDYPFYKIADPGLAEKAITVGAINDLGEMTDYSSNGPSASSKPDVVAPGGSHSWASNVGSEITSDDTNVNDAYTTGFADRQSNDYANLFGTSMAAPHVAGLAALLIDALESQGEAWVFDEFRALRVKMFILMTATETNKAGEESSGNNPSLDRGGKDRVEGYGRINADAAVEAIINSVECPPDTSLDVTLGTGVFERKCWASGLGLCGPDSFVITLNVPPGADYDLYLYEGSYTGDGEPLMAESSTQAAAGADESISINVGYVCVGYYLVAKRVSGSGTATISIEGTAPQTAVLIRDFKAHHEDSGVRLEWEVRSDEELRGFNIYRREKGTSLEITVNGDGLIPGSAREYFDRGILPSRTYEYALGAVLQGGSEIRSQPVAAGMKGLSLSLYQNYPNPFNPTTTIAFTLAKRERVLLGIYDLQGKLVKKVVDGVLDRGARVVRWDGRDANGNPASSGVYFYRLQAGKKVLTRKMVIVR